MAKIELVDLQHSYDAEGTPERERTLALKQVSHAWDDGGAYALLGPSGCGKTTLLNIISGLLRPWRGQVLFDGRDVTAEPPEQRNIAQVFQFPVIYDTMTVYDNLAFPLRNRKVAPEKIKARVEEVLGMLDMRGWADRKASRLAADAKQKISLARGMVREDVNAILFDEPLTVIDPHMKWQLRSQLKILHRKFGHTMIYVTHDQTEALTFADRVVVMYEGEIVQIGTPEDLFNKPEHTFVGYFIGSPGMNLFPVRVDGGGAYLGGQRIELAGSPEGIPGGAKVELGIRPERIGVAAEGIGFDLDRVDDIGHSKIVRGTLEGMPVAAVVGAESEIPAEPRLRFEPGGIGLYVDSWRWPHGQGRGG